MAALNSPVRALSPLLFGALIAAAATACNPAAPTVAPSPTQATTPAPTSAATTTPDATLAATPTSEAALPDPCVLVTKEEAAAATGATLADGLSELFSRPDGTSGRSCYYDGSDGQLNLNIWQATPEQAAAYKEEQRMYGDVEDVAGVGDSAYRVGWTSLIVQQDNYVLEYGIEMADYDPDTAQANLRTLALTSISRL